MGWLFLAHSPAMAANPLESSAVILAYYRVGEDSNPASNLRAEDFADHLDALSGDEVTPLPIPEILSALKNGKQLPKSTVGLSFEGAYKSLTDKTFPSLIGRNIPFTVFLNVAAIDAGHPQYMNWDEIRKLSGHKGITFGITPDFTAQDEVETKRILNKSIARFREQFGAEPKLLAYPQGEYTSATKALVRNAGFDAAFGLHSGALYEGSDFLSLPRFTMTENYGDLQRFKVVTHTLPLPVTDIQPEASLVESENALIGFSLSDEFKHLAPTIRCYASGQGLIKTELLGDNRIEIRPQLSRSERLRVNCATPTSRRIGFLLSVKEAPQPHNTSSNPEPDELPRPPE